MRANSKTWVFGPLTLSVLLDETGALRAVTLPRDVPDGLDAAALSAAVKELGRHGLAIAGTAFREKVWKRMRAIPWGSAVTYGELAKAVGSPGASRAVGHACGANPLPLIIPCHRVLAEEGLGGCAYGPAWKKRLLEIETEPQP